MRTLQRAVGSPPFAASVAAIFKATAPNNLVVR